MAVAEDLQQDITSWVSEHKSEPIFLGELDEGQVYSYGVPKGVNGNEIQKIIILIREISLQPNLYGSNHAQEEVANVQIQFFYPNEIVPDDEEDYDYTKHLHYDYYKDVEKPILDYLHDKEGWARTLGGGHDFDSDTEQIYSTYHIKKSVNYL